MQNIWGGNTGGLAGRRKKQITDPGKLLPPEPITGPRMEFEKAEKIVAFLSRKTGLPAFYVRQCVDAVSERHHLSLLAAAGILRARFGRKLWPPEPYDLKSPCGGDGIA